MIYYPRSIYPKFQLTKTLYEVKIDKAKILFYCILIIRTANVKTANNNTALSNHKLAYSCYLPSSFTKYCLSTREIERKKGY